MLSGERKRTHIAITINMAQDGSYSEADLLRFHNKLSEVIGDYMPDYYVSMTLENHEDVITAYLREEEIAKNS